MPTTLKKTYRQRLRWARSWWWMLPFVYARLSLKQLISPAFGLLQLVITPVMLAWIVVMTLLTLGGRYHSPGIALVYLAVYLVVRYGQSGLYVLMRPDMTARQRWRSWLVGTPTAVFMNIVLLCPTRYRALFKLRDNAWQSRGLTAKTALPKGGRHRAGSEDLLNA